MNREMLKRLVGKQVRIHSAAVRLNAADQPVPTDHPRKKALHLDASTEMQSTPTIVSTGLPRYFMTK